MLVALPVVASPAGASTGAGAYTSAGCGIKAESLSTRQSQVASGSARFSLRNRCPGGRKKPGQAVRLVLEAKQPWSRWTPVGLGKTELKRAPGTRTVRIKTFPSADELLGNCGRPRLRLTAIYRSRGKWVRQTSTFGKLKRQRSRCAVPAGVDLSRADSCDFISPPGNACMAPFPNDFYTRPDPTSETGRRIDIAPDATPLNDKGKPIAPEDLNLADGFSAGPLISVAIPGMDNQAAFDQTGIVPITDMSATYTASQPVVLIDAEHRRTSTDLGRTRLERDQ